MIKTMEACFLPSNSLLKCAEIVPSAIARFPIKNIGKKSCSYRFTKSGRLSYVVCCQVGSNSRSPSPEEIDWRSFRARLIAKEQISANVDLDTVVNQQPPNTTDSATIVAGVGIEDNKWAHTIHEPEKGCLLIATEKLDGVHIFEKTVVLLLSMKGRIGPMGLILNRPSLMSIKEKRSSRFDVGGTFSDRPLFFGGPLEDGLFLVNPKRENEWVGKAGVFEEIMKGFYYGNKESVGCAAEMVKRKALEVGDIRFFDGYCAWDNEQLRDEIRSGYWAVAACSPNVIGLSGVGGVGLWEEILGLMGTRKVW